MAKILKALFFYCAILLSCILLGWILLSSVYCLSISADSENIIKSSDQIMSEGTYPDLLLETEGTRLDNYTDALMINAAVYSVSSPFQDSLLVEINNLNDPINGLNSLTEGNLVNPAPYSYYWHGYLLFLKPLLALGLTHDSLRLVFALVIFVLSVVFAVLAIRKNKSVILLPLFAFMVCTASVCGIYSIQFFGVYFITLIAAIAHIGLSGISRKSCGLIFLLTGIFTSFIDLLTFPLLTLVVPFLVWLSVAERGSSNRSLVVNAALYIFLWGLGYFGMWCGKWVLATIVTNVDVIALATNSIIFRTSRGDSTSGSVLQAILLNYSYYKQSFFVIILPCLIFSVFVGIKGFRRNMFDKSKVIVPIVICCFVAIFPIIWIAILTNHSYIHSWFVYRICFISPLAIMSACLMPYLVHSRKNTAKENTSHM